MLDVCSCIVAWRQGGVLTLNQPLGGVKLKHFVVIYEYLLNHKHLLSRIN